MDIRRIAAMFFICLMAAWAMPAQASKFQGMWEGKMDHEGVMEVIGFQFQMKGGALTGKVFREGDEFGDITNAKVNGNKISFQADVVSFDGSLENDELKLTVTVMNGNKFYVTATRKK